MLRRVPRWILISPIVLGLALLASFWTPLSPVQAQTMPPTPDAKRLEPWPTVFPPSQADNGAQTYYLACMVCHGDRGQGLTEEWRSALEIPDRDCWQSGCHNPRHPPDGFVFPKIVPRVVGGGAMARFDTALDLYTFLQTKMPWHAPGSLSEETYWNLTAYLLRENKVDVGNVVLNPQTAAALRLRPAPTPTPVPGLLERLGPGNIWYLAVAAALAVAGILFAIRLVRTKI